MKHLKLFEDFKPENLTTLRIEQPNDNDDATFNNNKNLILLIDDIKKLKVSITEYMKAYARLYRKNIILTKKELNWIKTIYDMKDEYYGDEKILNLKKLINLLQHIISIPLENRETGKYQTSFYPPNDTGTLKKEFRMGNGFSEFVWLRRIYSDIDELLWRANHFINSYDRIYHYMVELDDEQIQQLKILYKELDNYRKTDIVNPDTVYKNIWSLLNINYDTTQSYKKLHGVKSRKYIPNKNVTNKK